MIGKILRNMRKESKLSEEKLAKKIGFSNTTLSQYENSKRQPTFEVIEKIANECGFEIIFYNKENNITYTSKNINREEI